MSLSVIVGHSFNLLFISVFIFPVINDMFSIFLFSIDIQRESETVSASH